jgi:hypothetical protein
MLAVGSSEQPNFSADSSKLKPVSASDSRLFEMVPGFRQRRGRLSGALARLSSQPLIPRVGGFGGGGLFGFGVGLR